LSSPNLEKFQILLLTIKKSHDILVCIFPSPLGGDMTLPRGSAKKGQHAADKLYRELERFMVTRLHPPAQLAGRRLISFLTLAHFSLDALTSMPLALLPIVQLHFGLTESTLALLVATLSFSTSLTQPVFGALADRIGRHYVAALGLMSNAILLSLVGIAATPFFLFLLFLLGGLGSGALHPAGASWVRAASRQRQDMAVSLFSTGGTLGTALGPLLVVYLVGALGTEALLWLMIPGLVMGLMLLVAAADEEPPAERATPVLFDWQLIASPVGLLSLVGIFSSIAFVAFTSTFPLWLVGQGIAPDAPLIGWTLSAFSLAAALGGMTAATLGSRFERRTLISTTLLLAPLPLLGLFWMEPGTLLYFIAVVLAGALLYASMPLLVVSAQNLAPNAMASASGMLMGFSAGIAGLLYIGMGRLQESIGLEPSLRVSYLALLPAAVIAFWLLRKLPPAQPATASSPMDGQADADPLCPPGLALGACA
jgi:MFS transporter, FSR family, fosmidomycin resistance protein